MVDQDGEWKYYFSSGELSYIAYFQKGTTQVIGCIIFRMEAPTKKETIKTPEVRLWITNYEDGKTLMKGSYVNGLENGEWLNWDNGKLKTRLFLKSGKLNGIWNSFLAQKEFSFC